MDDEELQSAWGKVNRLMVYIKHAEDCLTEIRKCIEFIERFDTDYLGRDKVKTMEFNHHKDKIPLLRESYNSHLSKNERIFRLRQVTKCS